jgi:dihydrofolate reductase
VPIFVVSHDQPVSINKDADFIFVTKDIGSAYRQTKSKEDKNVWILVEQILHNSILPLGLIDEISIDITPTLLGSRKRVFDIIGKYMELTLIKIKRYEGDLVELNYRVNT